MSHSTSKGSIDFTSAEQDVIASKLINLKQWRQNIFEADWHTVKDVLRTDQCQGAIVCRDRGESGPGIRIGDIVERSRYIPINDDCSVALVVSFKPSENNRFAVAVEFWPTDSPYLPSRLRLSILDEDNDPVIETHTRDDNQKIEMKFEGEEGDRFQVRMTLAEDSTTISFMV